LAEASVTVHRGYATLVVEGVTASLCASYRLRKNAIGRIAAVQPARAAGDPQDRDGFSGIDCDRAEHFWLDESAGNCKNTFKQ
jgi:hypothetical protein